MNQKLSASDTKAKYLFYKKINIWQGGRFKRNAFFHICLTAALYLVPLTSGFGYVLKG